jgi:hypothetical protein
VVDAVSGYEAVITGHATYSYRIAGLSSSHLQDNDSWAGADQRFLEGTFELQEYLFSWHEIWLTDAAASTPYDVKFCLFPNGTANCFSVGSVTTDAGGNVQSPFTFGKSGTW